jgi:uncharacterized protein (DUF4415 family)
MRKSYDFSTAKRAKDVPHLAKLQAAAQPGKTRVTMWVDTDVIAAFRERARKSGSGYQTEINRALRESALTPTLTADKVEAIVLKAVKKVSQEAMRKKVA